MTEKNHRIIKFIHAIKYKSNDIDYLHHLYFVCNVDKYQERKS
jgi:hypothetical protein